jgi:hypothetical protein
MPKYHTKFHKMDSFHQNVLNCHYIPIIILKSTGLQPNDDQNTVTGWNWTQVQVLVSEINKKYWLNTDIPTTYEC